MNGNLSIGRYGGVEVRLNWSLLAIVALIVWSLTDGVFPSENPGLSHNTYLGMAVVASLLFLASIVLHELGHSWVARREGIEVDGITLWLFGGVSQLKGRFASPGAEFRVAVSGPLVSIVLGVLFVLIAVAGLPSAVDGVAAWLGYINLILAAFNLLPASPLDGGRVLHAILWRSKGDFGWATRVASEIGQGFGYLFIALGIAMFIFEGSFSGAWLAFLGWFLLQGARAEARYVATERALGDLRVSDLMVPRPVTVDADSTIGRFMDDVASSHRFTTYPVLEGDRPVGLLAFASVAAVPRSEWDTRRVRDTTIPLDDVPLLTEDEMAVDALEELSAKTGNRGLVVDDGHLAGLLSITDIARALEVGRSPAQAPSPRPS
ncbi:MAG TPA: site-2 protease family protein [Gaiellaceae bacterium]|jgi:Zn-dependent protease/predicted transcriptional regulator|nr:site-2 protease family protein [Gaiellaceae bacterium]